IRHRVEGERAGDTGHGIEIELLDKAVAPEQLLDVLGGELRWRSARHRRCRSVRVRDTRAEVRFALRVELDRKIFEAHGVPSRSAEPEYPGCTGEMIVGRLQPTEQRTQRPVDSRELLRQWAGVVSDGFEPISDRGDTALGVEKSPRDGDQVAGEGQNNERDGDEGQRQEHHRLPAARSASTTATVLSFFSMAPATPSISVPTPIVASSALMFAVFRAIPPAACSVSAAYRWIDRADRHVRRRE